MSGQPLTHRTWGPQTVTRIELPGGRRTFEHYCTACTSTTFDLDEQAALNMLTDHPCETEGAAA
jgi:hypothetical protein